MAWHGPIGDCGCCNLPPPPPDCLCETNDCAPDGYFTAVQVVVSMDDMFEKFTEGYPVSTGCPCQNRPTTISEKRLSGMSAANGTYDIPYIKQVGDTMEFEEATPGVDCGWWFFPIIPVTLQYYDYLSIQYPLYCTFGSNFLRDNDTAVPFNFSTLSGRFTQVSGPTVSINFGTTESGTLPNGTLNGSISPYDCISLAAATSQDRPLPVHGAITANYQFLEDLFFNNVLDNTLPLPGFVAGPVGFHPPEVATVTYDGQLGHLGGYGGRRGICEIGWESITNTLSAYNQNQTVTFNCSGSSYQRYISVEWSAFVRSYSVLFSG